ncbi:hypothetical protein D915_008937 [Fasciola hepatica]|uniref:Uncharacterized protein n=1 Tax=Fasciola hepatica TaxID=6192 RepID=A0A4E0QYN1_FASHE|nr:hypothetical protein D915_008937 [Fasciola hepatica]
MIRQLLSVIVFGNMLIKFPPVDGTPWSLACTQNADDFCYDHVEHPHKERLTILMCKSLHRQQCKRLESEQKQNHHMVRNVPEGTIELYISDTPFEWKRCLKKNIHECSMSMVC